MDFYLNTFQMIEQESKSIGREGKNAYVNMIDWGRKNLVATAYGNSVLLWDAGNGSTAELSSFDGPVTTLSWAPDGRHIAIGLNNSEIQLWDSAANRRLRTFRQPVASLAWGCGGDVVLSAGGTDGLIVDNDVRAKSHVAETYRSGHTKEVVSLEWSGFGHGRHLASGGNDSLVHVWDRCMASSSSRLQLKRRAGPVLRWCPFQSNLVASGGGDHRIMLWNVETGACVGSADTGSAVRALMWNKNAGELLSSNHDRLSLWKYPSMAKVTDFNPHDKAQSPDGYRIASASGDGTLRLCNVFKAKPGWRKPEPVYKNLLSCR